VDLRTHGIDVPHQRGTSFNPEIAVAVGFGAMDRAVVANAQSE